MHMAFLDSELDRFLPLVIFLFFFVFAMLLKKKFREVHAGSPGEKDGGQEDPTERSRKMLMESLGLPENTTLSNPMLKVSPSKQPLLEHVSMRSVKQTEPLAFAAEKMTAEMTAARQQETPVLSFWLQERAQLQRAILMRELFGPPKSSSMSSMSMP